MKLLIYSHDTYGLGNIRRMLTIASHLANTDEDLSILLVSGSPMLHAFRIPPRIDYVKLPCVTRNREGEYLSPYLDLDFEEIIRLRGNIILSTVLDFRPDIVLVDKKPLGLGGELAPALDLLQSGGTRPRLVLLLRDILDSPENTCAIWQKNGYYDVLESRYDSVLVVGEQRIFDVAAEYGFPPAVARKTEYCGYLERQPGLRSRREVRRELGAGRQPLVLVTAGGGADGMLLMTTYLQGLAGAGRAPAFRTLMVSGPELSPGERARLKKQAARCQCVEIRDFSDDIMSYMDAADAVIAMGGYNTVCELLTLGKRAIIVPRVTPVLEQWIRAERLDAMGLATAVHPANLTPAGLMEKLAEALQAGDCKAEIRGRIAMDGLQRITARLLDTPALPVTPAFVPRFRPAVSGQTWPAAGYALAAE